MEPIQLTIYGEPAPAGSKKSIPLKNRTTGEYITRPDGSIIINTVDDNKKTKPWQAQVSAEAVMQYSGPLIVGPVKLDITFIRPRNKGHFGTGRNAGVLKDSAPLYPTVKPDTLKLARAVEDALTGIVWRDDNQVVESSHRKLYGERYETHISVEEIDTTTVGERVQGAQEELELVA